MKLDYPVDKAFELIYNLDLRTKWDKIFSQMKVVKIFDEDIDLVYSYIKAPMII